ncbi:helix-turn-helix domain-containing protein [Paludifilum halophilum]|uniref:Helix-turn-helix domain-containing protein n=1 Tax=Paludifilum halophilum TaxID=1642702 RepID=A0A235B6H9_9BACL|nr:helix-turn-helix domain-containing protein [Paludifilum halophilum]OYD07896.1 hypothetical protein CHM34_07155 [Paludifilum halophilum]
MTITPLPNREREDDQLVSLLKSIADLNEQVIQLVERGQREQEKTDVLVYSIDQAAEALGVSRSKLYEMIHIPGFPVVSVGHRKLIPRKALENWLHQQCEGR